MQKNARKVIEIQRALSLLLSDPLAILIYPHFMSTQQVETEYQSLGALVLSTKHAVFKSDLNLGNVAIICDLE